MQASISPLAPLMQTLRSWEMSESAADPRIKSNALPTRSMAPKKHYDQQERGRNRLFSYFPWKEKDSVL